MVTTRVLVVDDSVAWRISVGSVLKRNASLQVIGEARDGVDAIEKAATLHPDVVLLDIGMPRLNGIEAARIIRQSCPESRIIFLTQEDDSDVRSIAFESGASAYVLKSSAASELLCAIEGVISEGKAQSHQPGHRSPEPTSPGDSEPHHSAVEAPVAALRES